MSSNDEETANKGLVNNGNETDDSEDNSWASSVSVGCFLLIPIGIFTAIILLPMSLRKLASTEFGIKYTRYSKILDDAALSGGLHTGPPGFRFIKFPSTFVTNELPPDTCLSRDGLRVETQVDFQYQIPADWLLPAILKYRDFENWSTIVESAAISAVQHTCSEFNVSNFQNMRGEIQRRMEDNLRLKLEGEAGDGESGVYARAVSLQLRNVDLPFKYQEAVAVKQSATEDITLARNERIQETTKARTDLLAAQEQARIINDTAVNEADIILTEARIKAQETTFAFATEADVIVQVKEKLSLSTAGVLAYLSNRLYEVAPHLKVSAAEPASLSRSEEL